jgi:pteridine reductase
MSTTRPVALVTGAGRRVGQAIAIAVAKAGYDVAVHHRSSPEGASDTIAAIAAVGGAGRPFAADLSDASAPATLIADVISTFGGLDLLVNSAAIMEKTPPGTVTTESWDAMFALNARAPFFLSQAAAPHLAERNGAIVNISDHLLYDHDPNFVPHALSKAVIDQMTRSLAATLAPRVRVNAVTPGVVLMPEWSAPGVAERLAESTPLKRLGSPQDVADAVCWLAQARFVTGETIRADGGRHLFR